MNIIVESEIEVTIWKKIFTKFSVYRPRHERKAFYKDGEFDVEDDKEVWEKLKR